MIFVFTKRYDWFRDWCAHHGHDPSDRDVVKVSSIENIVGHHIYADDTEVWLWDLAPGSELELLTAALPRRRPGNRPDA